jgi:pimeloyl-ACP methyl ester carboxylesterase
MDGMQHSPTRRTAMVGAGLAGVALGGMIAPAQAQIDRKTFVLVHGSSAGGWCYRRVSDILESRGHKVFAPTLTGLGERSHLMSGLITLDTHITDVVNVIRWENLDNFVLVGHSYGGWIISGVAEQVEKKISSIVFLDAFMPENGQRVLDTNSPRSRAEIEEAVRKAEVSRPAPYPSVWKVNEKDQPWVQEKFTAEPIGVAFTPIKLTGAREDLRSGDGLRQSKFRESLRQDEGRSILAHVRNAVRPRSHDRHAGADRGDSAASGVRRRRHVRQIRAQILRYLRPFAAAERAGGSGLAQSAPPRGALRSGPA